MQTPIGFIISWHVPTNVALQQFRDGVTRAGYDALDLVPDLKPASLVARTAGLIARKTSTKDAKQLARKIDYTKRQITREERDPNGLTYSAEDHVSFDDATGQVINSLGSPIAEQQEITETRRATDVTRVVQAIVESAGSDLIQIREQGGAYFVPAGHQVIDKVRTVIEAVGGRLQQFACTIGHGADAQYTGQSVAQVITDYLLKQIEELKEAVAELNEAKIRSDVRRARLSKVADLKERIQSYAVLLGTQESALSKALTQAEDALLAKLGPSKDEPEVGAKDAAFAEAVAGEPRAWEGTDDE